MMMPGFFGFVQVETSKVKESQLVSDNYVKPFCQMLLRNHFVK